MTERIIPCALLQQVRRPGSVPRDMRKTLERAIASQFKRVTAQNLSEMTLLGCTYQLDGFRLVPEINEALREVGSSKRLIISTEPAFGIFSDIVREKKESGLDVFIFSENENGLLAGDVEKLPAATNQLTFVFVRRKAFAGQLVGWQEAISSNAVPSPKFDQVVRLMLSAYNIGSIREARRCNSEFMSDKADSVLQHEIGHLKVLETRAGICAKLSTVLGDTKSGLVSAQDNTGTSIFEILADINSLLTATDISQLEPVKARRIILSGMLDYLNYALKIESSLSDKLRSYVFVHLLSRHIQKDGAIAFDCLRQDLLSIRPKFLGLLEGSSDKMVAFLKGKAKDATFTTLSEQAERELLEDGVPQSMKEAFFWFSIAEELAEADINIYKTLAKLLPKASEIISLSPPSRNSDLGIVWPDPTASPNRQRRQMIKTFGQKLLDMIEPRTIRSSDKRAGSKTRKPFVRQGAKIGRNDPCPCGSGKKHKKCCG